MKQTAYDCIIIGGGASGVLAALSFRQHWPDGRIILLEKEARLLRKVSASGNGRCNLSNRELSLKHYHTLDSPLPQLQRVVRTAFKRFGFDQTRQFFSRIGVPWRIDSQGRCYPYCEHASAVIKMLETALIQADIEVRTNTEVKRIERADTGKWIIDVTHGPLTATGTGQKSAETIIQANAECLDAINLILATGSQAASTLGGSESGYQLLRSLKQPITELRPALVPLILASEEKAWLESVAGERFRGRADLYQKGNHRARASGEFLFARDGLSGIAAMELARDLETDLPAYLEIDFLADWTEKEVEDFLQAKRTSFPSLTDSDLLTGLLRPKLARGIARRKYRHLPRELKKFRLEISGTRGFKYAQIVSGGLDLRAVNPLTLALKAYPTCYVCGEILDVDGQTGGYNLQWAWSSGYLAGSLS